MVEVVRNVMTSFGNIHTTFPHSTLLGLSSSWRFSIFSYFPRSLPWQNQKIRFDYQNNYLRISRHYPQPRVKKVKKKFKVIRKRFFSSIYYVHVLSLLRTHCMCSVYFRLCFLCTKNKKMHFTITTAQQSINNAAYYQQ